MKINIDVELSDNEVDLIKSTDWNKEIDEDSKYCSLLQKGLISMEFFFDNFITYLPTELGCQVINQIKNEKHVYMSLGQVIGVVPFTSEDNK